MSFNSKNYWENRYRSGGNSGEGSHGYLKEYKNEIINNFIKKNKIKSIIDFGCGDGNQIENIDILNYYGYDVSNSTINRCKEMFKNTSKSNFNFYTINDSQEFIKAELGLSLDVIYHLVEDNVFHTYMKNLFDNSEKFVIIYSNDYNADNVDPLTNKHYAPHVKPRNFTKYIETYFSKWFLIENIKNKYFGNNGVWSDFYIFQKL